MYPLRVFTPHRRVSSSTPHALNGGAETDSWTGKVKSYKQEEEYAARNIHFECQSSSEGGGISLKTLFWRSLRGWLCDRQDSRRGCYSPYCATGELTSGSGPGCPSTTDSGLSWAQESDTFLSSGWICVSINIFVLPVFCLVVHRNRRHCVLFFCKFNSIGTTWTHSSRDLCPMTPMCDLRDIIDSV